MNETKREQIKAWKQKHPLKKVGRRPSEDALYALELGVSRRIILRHGGAQYLKLLEPHARNLMLKSTYQ